MKKGGRNKTFTFIEKNEALNESLPSLMNQNQSLLDNKMDVKYFSMRSDSKRKNEESKRSKISSLRRHSSFKRKQKEPKLERKNSSPIGLKVKISELEIGEISNYTMGRRKSNQSVTNLRKLNVDSQSRGIPVLPDVIGFEENNETQAPPRRIGTYFQSAKNSMAKSPSAWESHSKTPSLQNIPLKATHESIFNQDIKDTLPAKTAEHLAMIKKLEEYKETIKRLTIKDISVPNDLEYSDSLDSLIDSINTVLTCTNWDLLKTENLNLATGIRTDYCQHLLLKLKLLRQKSVMFEEMYSTLKSMTDKFILLETQYLENSQKMIEYK